MPGPLDALRAIDRQVREAIPVERGATEPVSIPDRTPQRQAPPVLPREAGPPSGPVDPRKAQMTRMVEIYNKLRAEAPGLIEQYELIDPRSLPPENWAAASADLAKRFEKANSGYDTLKAGGLVPPDGMGANGGGSAPATGGSAGPGTGPLSQYSVAGQMPTQERMISDFLQGNFDVAFSTMVEGLRSAGASLYFLQWLNRQAPEYERQFLGRMGQQALAGNVPSLQALQFLRGIGGESGLPQYEGGP